MNNIKSYIQEKLVINKNIKMDNSDSDFYDTIIDIFDKPDFIIKLSDDIEDIYPNLMDNDFVHFIRSCVDENQYKQSNYPIYCYVSEESRTANHQKLDKAILEYRKLYHIATQNLLPNTMTRGSKSCVILYDTNYDYQEIYVMNNDIKTIALLLPRHHIEK